MLERLVESWLDSASERSYQAPFCQMLAADGHLVVHSTRHSPIEFGKDVITIKDGVPCAFQLKGNPGSRLTLVQFREIQGQLLQLATQPIVYPGINPAVRHRCYLVTNGEVDEEAQRALDDVNRQLHAMGYEQDRIHLWSRGRLLELANRLGSSLWPSEIEDLNVLLELIVHRGDSILPTQRFHLLLRKLLGLNEQRRPGWSAAELRRRISSGAILVAVALRNFSLAENWYAVISAWTMFAAYASAAAERHRVAFGNVAAASVKLATDAIYDALASLCDEIVANPKLRAKTGMAIGPMHRGRATLVYALVSLYWLWSEHERWLVPAHREFLETWIPRDFNQSFLWGEGAVPQMLTHYWYLSRTDATMSSEFALAGILRAVISFSLGQHGVKFPSPYFPFDQVMRHHLASFLKSEDPLQDETVHMNSFYAEGLLHLLVRTNLKQNCKALWPDFSRLGLKQFRPERRWQYALAHSDRGTEVTVQPLPTKTWSALVDEARDCRVRSVPVALSTNYFLLLIFIIVFPYRGTPEVIRYLGKCLGTVWFLPPAI